jgi:SAM-dependent methyltransferase
MSCIGSLHGAYVHSRRVRVLSKLLADLLSPGARVLDVGCGDGLLAALVLRHRGDASIHGIDTLVRPSTHIPVQCFDGATIPFADGSFDDVMFVDVLHHTVDPMVLLREARRVARRAVVLKDHTLDGWLAGSTLRLMDWVGNARYGVSLPFNYWPRTRWVDAFSTLALNPVVWKSKLGLYPGLADYVFGRSLHFVARLEPCGTSQDASSAAASSRDNGSREYLQVVAI